MNTVRADKTHVGQRVTVTTDEVAISYSTHEEGYKHDIIKHKKHYVLNNIHTQMIENIWSHLKEITGIYRHVSKKYPHTYADEYDFRYNYRKDAG